MFFHDICNSKSMTKKIQKFLPSKLQIVETESTRGGIVGTEVGISRERVLLAMFQVLLGEKRVVVDISSIEREVDVIIDGLPISIKTAKSQATQAFREIKLSWCGDVDLCIKTFEDFVPTIPIMFLCINWNENFRPKKGSAYHSKRWRNEGAIYFFPVNVQIDVLNQIGKENFLRIPTRGTYSKGVSIKRKATIQMIDHPDTLSISLPCIWDDNLELHSRDRWMKSWRDSLKFKNIIYHEMKNLFSSIKIRGLKFG